MILCDSVGGGGGGGELSCFVQFAAAVCMDTASHGTGQDVNHGCL